MKDKSNRGPTWVGFYPRVTKTKKEKQKAADRRQKQKGWNTND